MTDPIDDRRRFKELWKELLFARVATAPLHCAAWFIAAKLLHIHFPTCLVPVALAFATASGIAKRGWWTGPVVAASVIVSEEVSYWFPMVLGHDVRSDLILLLPVVMSAAIGLTEGLMERSTATAYCGMLGGMAFGYGAARMSIWLVYVSPWEDVFWDPGSAYDGLSMGFVLMAGFMSSVVSLGIGLSLALGRWIRDLPKRKAEAEEHHEPE